MGERKGQNHYYPPDYDPNKGGLNKFLGTHALRERARKLHLGILIIRFEMPYNIWCDGCQLHVGMGVRYNAEKTKVGMYYSTPVYQFKMKCTGCDNHYVIKTDPGNLDYVIVSGARRQENRWDPTDNGQIVPDDKNVQKRLFDDAMFKLEHGEKDQSTAKSIAPALGRLAMQRDERWKDDYAANCALRAKFRVKRRELKAKSEDDAALLARSSLAITLLPETEEDRKMASLLSLAPSRSMHERNIQTRDEIIRRPALPSCLGNATTFMGVRASKYLEKNVSEETLGVVRKKIKLDIAAATSQVEEEERGVANICQVVNEEALGVVRKKIKLTSQVDEERGVAKICQVVNEEALGVVEKIQLDASVTVAEQGVEVVGRRIDEEALGVVQKVQLHAPVKAQLKAEQGVKLVGNKEALDSGQKIEVDNVVSSQTKLVYTGMEVMSKSDEMLEANGDGKVVCSEDDKQPIGLSLVSGDYGCSSSEESV